ncbi:F-box only protein 21-like [Venturia canescens]|uniref:F-box only protein 21-like n=1 Tax=Venturia canescens TaxID=32260 RepID=UPI001C9D2A9E|nr:F-box only protein 21-like [Venturia canescens]
MITSDVLVNSLPCEVLDQILENEDLQITDVVNFSLTCKHLYWTVSESNKLWRTKFLQRWPHLQEAFDELHNTAEETKNPNWRYETKERLLTRRRLLEKLSRMSAKHYGKMELSAPDMKEYDPMFLTEYGARLMSYHYLVDELIMLIEQPLEICNLTHKHYAYKVVTYLKQTYLAKEWEKFVALSPEKQTSERGAILVAQWSQPEKRVSPRKVSEMIDDMAQKTRNLITESYPDIPINLVPRETLARWKTENLKDNQWDNEYSRTIVSALCKVMFHDLGFHGNSEMYYSSKNSFIDEVLIHKQGIPITLAIVFESAARRLGLHCETVSFPAHFLLRWKERYIPRTKEDEEVESYYIDVFNGGQFLTRNSCSAIAGATRCPIEKYNFHRTTSAVKVVQRMANNLEVAGRQRTQLYGRAARLRSALELLHLVKPRDTNTIIDLGRFYMLHQMDVTGLIETLNDMLLNSSQEEQDSLGQAKHIIEMLEDYEKRIELNSPKPKKRTPEIKYAVGMIMTDTLNHRCVITGWDTKWDKARSNEYTPELISAWVHGNQQPFYYIYGENGSSRYAAQENLFISNTPAAINHHEIGKNFCKFMKTYYMPNEEKAREYPEDEEFRDKMLRILYNAAPTTSSS